MYNITIDTNKCKGNGDCVESYPVTILAVVDNKAVGLLRHQLIVFLLGDNAVVAQLTECGATESIIGVLTDLQGNGLK